MNFKLDTREDKQIGVCQEKREQGVVVCFIDWLVAQVFVGIESESQCHFSSLLRFYTALLKLLIFPNQFASCPINRLSDRALLSSWSPKLPINQRSGRKHLGLLIFDTLSLSISLFHKRNHRARVGQTLRVSQGSFFPSMILLIMINELVLFVHSLLNYGLFSLKLKRNNHHQKAALATRYLSTRKSIH